MGSLEASGNSVSIRNQPSRATPYWGSNQHKSVMRTLRSSENFPQPDWAFAGAKGISRQEWRIARGRRFRPFSEWPTIRSE
jgi:hypothetical protein